MRSLAPLFVLALTLAVLVATPPAADAAKPGPSGAFRNDSGTLQLVYEGEGMVSVKLKTTYCELNTSAGTTFAFPQGIHVVNDKGEPILVLFYTPKAVTVYGELPAFAAAHCKGGRDATGVYVRAKRK